MDNNFQMKTGGRGLGQSIYSAEKLLEYIKGFENNRIYGIGRFGKGILILDKNEVISKTKIEDKIKELEDNVAYFEKTDNTGRFKKENSIDYYKLVALKELLEEL